MNQISDSFNGLMKEISERRSVRRYTDAPVDDQLLNRLLEVAGHTQTMGNLQLYSVVVTRSEEKKRQLAPAHFNQPMVTQAPVVLTFCADYCRTTAWCEQRKATPGYGNFLSFVNAATDALLFARILHPGRSSGAGPLLSRHNDLPAFANHQCAPVAETRHARCHHHIGMAR